MIITFIFSLLLIFVLGMIFSSQVYISVFYFIGCIFLLSFAFFSLNLTYISLLFILFYLGAIVVLFLMIVFLIGFEPTNDEAKADKKYFFYYIIFFEIIFFLVILIWFSTSNSIGLNFDNFSFFISTPLYKMSYIDTLYYDSSFLFNFAFYIFEYIPIALLLVCIILLLAMMGAIIITSYSSKNIKNTNKN